jgi:N-methylhydantoinase B
VQVFDFGPSIEDLRRNCETETGLAAPVQPRWTDLAIAAE